MSLVTWLLRAWNWFWGSPKPFACEFWECEKDAHAFVCWGRDPRQRANFCQEHCLETWEAARSQIAVGICWWIQEAPKAYRSVPDGETDQ